MYIDIFNNLKKIFFILFINLNFLIFSTDQLNYREIVLVEDFYYLNPKHSNNGYRLPLEEEWLYAASNKGKTLLNYGSGASDSYENIEATEKIGWIETNSSGKAHIVGTKESNELGIYDMTGNVWEWCIGSSGDKKKELNSVIKGGSFYYSNKGEWNQIGFSTKISPAQTYNYFGFRVARSKS